MRRFMRMFRFPLLLIAALCAGMVSRAPAAEPTDYYIVPPRCPDDAMALHTANPLNPAVSADDTIEIKTDPGQSKIRIDKDRNTEIDGRVEVRQGQRQFSADNVKFDSTEGHIEVNGKVEYRDPQMVVRGDTGSL